MTRLQADLLLVFAALIWGTAFYFQKVAMAHIGPFLFLGLRALIAATAHWWRLKRILTILLTLNSCTLGTIQFR